MSLVAFEVLFKTHPSPPLQSSQVRPLLKIASHCCLLCFVLFCMFCVAPGLFPQFFLVKDFWLWVLMAVSMCEAIAFQLLCWSLLHTCNFSPGWAGRPATSRKISISSTATAKDDGYLFWVVTAGTVNSCFHAAIRRKMSTSLVCLNLSDFMIL